MPSEEWIRTRTKTTLAGDLKAFRELVEAFQSPVRGVIAMFGVRADSVEDVAQEAFLAVYNALGSFDQSRPFVPWLRAIARNKSLQFLYEEEGRRRATESVAQMLGLQALDEKTAEREESFHKGMLAECLKRLSEASARLIRDKYEHGKSAKDIARGLNLSTEAVRMSLLRIRIKLKECIHSRIAEVNS